MNKQGPTARQLVLIGFFVASCVGLALFLWRAFGGAVPMQAKPYTQRVDFRQSSQVAAFADVRISGVNVGKVLTVQRDRDRTNIKIQIYDKFVPLPADTRATLRTKTLLGEAFVDLSFGTHRKGAPTLPDGGRVSSGGIVASTQLDQILDSFTPAIRGDMKNLIMEIDRAGRGRGPDLSLAGGEAIEALEGGTQLSSVFARQKDAVQEGTANLAQIFETLGNRAGQVQTIVHSGRQLTDVTAQLTTQLKESARAFPTTMQETRKTLDAAREASEIAKPTFAALRPVLPLIRPTGDALRELSPQVAAMFQESNGVPSKLAKALPEYVKVFDSVGPLTDAMVPVGGDLVASFRYTRKYERDASVVFANAGNLNNSYAPDSDGVMRAMLRATLPINGEALFGQAKRHPNSRSNAYNLPNSLDEIGRQQKSLSCEHTGNPNPGGLIDLLSPFPAAPCVEQGPITFQGKSSLYPHVETSTAENLKYDD